MRASILAIGLVCLLSFSSVQAPVSAADLTMPVKAPPPPVEEVVGFCWPCILFAAAVIACVIECPGHHHENVAFSPAGRRAD